MGKILHLLSIVLFLSVGCRPSAKPENENTYFMEILQFRSIKDKFLKESPDSPLPPSAREQFDSLDYFEIDPGYKVIADFLPATGHAMLPVRMNNGQTRAYIRHGFAVFSLDTISCSLLVLKSDNSPGSLFIPFYDKTNGFETYGGGRYLDPVQISNSKLALDFNRAYNPFCAYSPDYVCALPPKENNLPVPIPAGEKTFESH